MGGSPVPGKCAGNARRRNGNGYGGDFARDINRRRAVRTFWFLKVEGGYLPCGDYAYSPPVVVRIVDGGNSDMRRLSCNAQE